jgi:hypothetical protein
MNTIMCLEPWGGDGLSKKDTGLGNRLIHWSTLHYIASLHKNCELIIQKQYWPELEFLSLPNTNVVDISFSEAKKNSLSISSLDVGNILISKDISLLENSKFNRYYSDEYVRANGEILVNAIRKIKFKNENINQYFEQKFSDFCSIHLRRGLGTVPTIGFMKDYIAHTNKNKLKDYLKNYYSGYGSYLTISDTAYFSIIEDIISKNKNQKIYISSDIPENYYSYYFEKYPDNIISRNQYIDEFLNLFEYDETKVKTYKYSLKQTLINLFDLFVLSYSKTLIIDGSSTWGEIASLIHKNKKIINLINHICNKEKISYKEFEKTYEYYEYRPLKDKFIQLNIEKLKMGQPEPDEDTLKDLVDDWYFSDNEKEDIIVLLNQIEIWISAKKIFQIDENLSQEYVFGWNDCIDNLKKKLQ